MAGYVFAIGGNANPVDVIRRCAEAGVYSTYLSSLSPIPFEGTMADYMSMKPGDNIYFFCKRKYYGVGELVNVGIDCKYCNFPNSSARSAVSYNDIQDELLVDYGANSSNYRWLCTFKGSPFFFEDGIDTDEILTYKPNTFKMLRAFWKLSFIKIDEIENQALKDIILYRNCDTATQEAPCDGIYCSKTLPRKLCSIKPQYRLNPQDYFKWSQDKRKSKSAYYRRESTLECNMMYDLSTKSSESANNIFGNWDYVSHQVIASPFKPIDYMDKMDIWGYEYIKGFQTVLKYKVCELKKGIAGEEELLQCMKYVEWIRDKYAHGDYSKIKAFLVAADFALPADWKNIVKRNYVSGLRDVRTPCWEDLTLVKYRYDESIKRAVYEVYKNAEK